MAASRRLQLNRYIVRSGRTMPIGLIRNGAIGKNPIAFCLWKAIQKGDEQNEKNCRVCLDLRADSLCLHVTRFRNFP